MSWTPLTTLKTLLELYKCLLAGVRRAGPLGASEESAEETMESEEAREPVWPGLCLSSDWAEMPTECGARARLATPQPGPRATLSQWNSPPRNTGRLLSTAG